MSSTFLLSGCLVKVSSAMPLFTFVYQSVHVETVDHVQYYFQCLAKSILEGLIDNYGPIENDILTTGNTKDLRLVDDYNTRTIPLSQILSRVDHIATYNYTIPNDNNTKVQITALSSMPVAFGNSGCTSSQNDNNIPIFDWSAETGEIIIPSYYIESVSIWENGYLARITKTEKDSGYGDFFSGTTIDLKNSPELGDKQLYLYNNTNNGNVCLFYVENGEYTDSYKNTISDLIRGNCNVAYKDHQGLPETIGGTSSDIPNKEWICPLVSDSIDRNILGIEGLGKCALYNMEKAKKEYVTDSLIGHLACELIVAFMFGNEDLSQGIPGSGLSYYKPVTMTTDVKSSSKSEANINEYISGLTLQEFYDIVMESTDNDYTGEYYVFIRSAVLFMTGKLFDYYAEGSHTPTLNNIEKDNFEAFSDIIDRFSNVVAEKIIGKDAYKSIGSYASIRNYETTVKSIVSNSLEKNKGFFGNIMTSENYDSETGKLLLYKIYLSDKMYDESLQNNLNTSNYSGSKYSSWNHDLQSVIINAKATSEFKWDWEGGANPFEGDKESEKEFRNEYTSGDDGNPSLDISKITISLTLDNNKYTPEAYKRLENMKIYLLTHSGTSSSYKQSIQLLPINASWDSDGKIMTLVYSIKVSVTSFYEETFPPLYEEENRKSANITLCEDDELLDGYGAYYSGLDSKKDYFAELIFVRPENFNINLSLCGIQLDYNK